MKINTLFILICLSLLAQSLFGQTPAPVPEEARRHFVKGSTLFKEAKTADDFSLVINEFKEASDLAPQWPDARYNLGLAKEAIGDYAGAMADLKLYLQFKLADAEARAIQDKIYALEAKADLAAKKQKQAEDEANSPKAKWDRLLKTLDGGVWLCEHSDNKQYKNGRLDADFCCAGPDQAVGHTYIAVIGRTIRFYSMNGEAKNISYDPTATPLWTVTLTSPKFEVSPASWPMIQEITISNDGQTISDEGTHAFTQNGNNYVKALTYNFVRMR
jgi:tetratricopeptide (TPR) repeat protein